MHRKLGLIISLLFISISAQAQESAPLTNLKQLLDGNQRFVAGKLKLRDYAVERVPLAEGQHPYAIIVTCSDSRLSPEILFDESLGRLFVIRTAGHVVDPVVLGSVEYAAEHLHVNLIFFLGHESCGAVKATIAGGEFSPNILALTTRIRPAVDKALNRGLSDKELLNAAISENVQYQMSLALFQSDPLRHLVDEHKVMMAGGVYSLRTGRVQLVDPGMMLTRVEATDGEAAKLTNGDEKKEAAETVAGVESNQESFADNLRQAYEEKTYVMLKKSLLMRNSKDRCYFDDCRIIAAGEKVKFDNPMVLTIMGRPQVKVIYKGKHVYVLADREAFSEM